MAIQNPTKHTQKALKRLAIKHNFALFLYACRELNMVGQRKKVVVQAVAEAMGLADAKMSGEAILQAFWDADPKHGDVEPREWHLGWRRERRAARGPRVPRQPKKAKPGDVNSDEFLKSFEWRQLRMVVLKKRGARCECCGATPANGIVIHVDHIKPRRRYPELALEESNLQILCEVCNHGKGSWDDTDWRAVSQSSGESSADSPVTRSGDGDGKMKPVVGWPRLVKAR